MAATPETPDPPELLSDIVPPYRPVSRLKRLLIVGPLGVGTALGIAWLMLERPFNPLPLPPPAAEAPAEPAPASDRCADGQTTGCVGGRTQVLIVPAAPPPSAPSAPAAAR
jgi:hypothetical protein